MDFSKKKSIEPVIDGNIERDDQPSEPAQSTIEGRRQQYDHTVAPAAPNANQWYRGRLYEHGQARQHVEQKQHEKERGGTQAGWSWTARDHHHAESVAPAARAECTQSEEDGHDAQRRTTATPAAKRQRAHDEKKSHNVENAQARNTPRQDASSVAPEQPTQTESVTIWRTYTDGSWIPPTPDCRHKLPAGWAKVTFKQTNDEADGAYRLGQRTQEGYDNEERGTIHNIQIGQVVVIETHTGAINDGDIGDIGAKAHTNNTGELTAIYAALHEALQRPPGKHRDIIESDSTYSINMATGRWNIGANKRNRTLVLETRKLWTRLRQTRPNEVTIRHVRSHTGTIGNEIADWAAGQAVHGRSQISEQQATQWLDAWIGGVGVEGDSRDRDG